MEQTMTTISPLLSSTDLAVQRAIDNPVSRLPGDNFTSRTLRKGFATFGEVAPGVMAWAALQLFIRPRRFATPAREREHQVMAEAF